MCKCDKAIILLILLKSAPKMVCVQIPFLFKTFFYQTHKFFEDKTQFWFWANGGGHWGVEKEAEMERRKNRKAFLVSLNINSFEDRANFFHKNLPITLISFNRSTIYRGHNKSTFLSSYYFVQQILSRKMKKSFFFLDILNDDYSVTRLQYYFSTFDHLHQWKFAQKYTKCAKVGSIWPNSK